MEETNGNANPLPVALVPMEGRDMNDIPADNEEDKKEDEEEEEEGGSKLALLLLCCRRRRPVRLWDEADKTLWPGVVGVTAWTLPTRTRILRLRLFLLFHLILIGWRLHPNR